MVYYKKVTLTTGVIKLLQEMTPTLMQALCEEMSKNFNLDQSESNECSSRFMVQQKGQSTTGGTKLLQEMSHTVMEAL